MEGKHKASEIKGSSAEVELKNMTEALSLDDARQAKIKPVLEKIESEKSKASGKDKTALKAIDGYQNEIQKVLKLASKFLMFLATDYSGFPSTQNAHNRVCF